MHQGRNGGKAQDYAHAGLKVEVKVKKAPIRKASRRGLDDCSRYAGGVD